MPIVYDLVAFDPSMHANTALDDHRARDARHRRAPLRGVAGDLAGDRRRARRALPGERAPARSLRTWVPRRRDTGELTSAEAAALPAPGFVLAVGTLEPRKNLPRLVAAYRALEDELQIRHPLVVVGALGWETGPTLTALQSLGERCTMLGFVSDAALSELYRRCAVFCYPSLGEGYGLPVVEAMAAGAAVITSNISSLPEVGGDAADYVDPREVASITAGLRRVLGDASFTAPQLSRRGLARAKEFSWESFAERTLEVLQAASNRS